MRILLLIITLSITFFNTAWAVTPLPDTAPTQSVLIPGAPQLDAKAYILMDANTGHIIVQKNADVRREPASLTKLMTLYLVFAALDQGTIKLDDKVHISEKAWRTGGSRMFVKAGDDVPVNQLIQGVIVESGNDATVALAEYVAGSESSFVDMMNITAKRLGMKNSHFADATGLPIADHYSSAMDLALLTDAIVQQFPEYYHYFSEKWFTYNGIRQPNRNRLLWRFNSTDGGKTGHTDKAGYCLIASAKKGDMRLISVVLGAPTDEERAADSIRLLTYGFRFFESEKLFDANTALIHGRVWGGEKEEIGFGLAKPLYVTIPVGAGRFVKTSINLDPKIKAAVKKGTAFGTVEASYDGKVIASQPLVALRDDDKGGWWTRTTDSISMTVHGWFGSKDKQEKAKPKATTPKAATNSNDDKQAPKAATNSDDNTAAADTSDTSSDKS